jgi:thiosulfate dehydrogenase [quinone] large subunit
LTATFNVRPYFYGSDTAYAVMWLAYFLILQNGLSGRRGLGAMRFDINRRGVMRIGAVAGISGAFMGLGHLFPRNVLPIAKAANKRIVALSKVPVGGTFNFTSASGAPALLFRTKTGVFAYNLTCTHQGCTVEYAPSLKQLRCACHGAAFDPMKSAKVVAGPAPRPLEKIKVKIIGKNIVEI